MSTHDLDHEQICIGPICIPVWGLLPFLGALFYSVRNWFLETVLGRSPAKNVTLPERSKEGEKVHHATNETNFNEFIRNHERVVLDFTATWCGP